MTEDNKQTESKEETKIPPYDLLSVSVPGAVDGWFSMHEKFGSLPFNEILLNHRDLLYGKCNKKDGYNLIDSCEDEIFNTIFSSSNLSVVFEDDMLIKYTENNNLYYWG